MDYIAGDDIRKGQVVYITGDGQVYPANPERTPLDWLAEGERVKIRFGDGALIDYVKQGRWLVPAADLLEG